jgi:ribosomal protein S15P/S13E
MAKKTKKIKKPKKAKVLSGKQRLLKKIEHIKKHLKKAKQDKQGAYKLKLFEAQLK